MTVSETWVERLATLAADCRPHGATRWDVPGTMAAIRKVKHLALPDVARAVINAAEDRTVETPGVIANLRSACWRDRPVRPAPTEVLTAADRCGICSHARHDSQCPRCSPIDDHTFAPDFKTAGGSAVDELRDIKTNATRCDLRHGQTTPTTERHEEDQ